MYNNSPSTGISDLVQQWRIIADQCEKVATRHEANPNELQLAREQKAFAYARRSCAQQLENALKLIAPNGPARVRAALEALVGVTTRHELEQMRYALRENDPSAPDPETAALSINAVDALLETL